MNILFLLGKYPNIGGVESVTTFLSNAFCKKGNIVHIVSFEQSMPDLIMGLDSSIKLWELSYPVFSKRNIQKLKGIVYSNSIDIIINQWCIPYNITRLCKRAIKGTSCKLIAVHHNLPNKNTHIVNCEIELEKSINGIKKMFYLIKLAAVKKVSSINLKLVYLNSDKFVVLSESFKNVFSEFANIRDFSKLISISNPITINEDYVKTKKEKKIIYVGRIDFNQKRVIRIIKAWEDIYKKYPNWKLFIIGDGPDKNNLEDYVLSNGIKNISFEGFLDPVEYYKKASILLLTSEYEGFGLVVVEGMKFGVVPIVYGSYSAIHDIINNGINGLITPPPYQHSNTVEAIERLINNERLILEMSDQAIINSSRFLLSEVVQEWENLFSKLIPN